MALANKEHLQNGSAMAIIQASAFYDHDFGGPTLIHTSSHSSREDHIYGLSEHSKRDYPEPESPEKAAKNFTMSNSSSVSSPSSTNSNGLGYQPGPAYSTTHVAEEGHSVISFKPEFGNFTHVNAGSLLSFDQTKRIVLRNLNPKMIAEEDEYPMWEAAAADDHHMHYQSEMNIHGPPETSSSHHAAAEPWAWLNDQEPSGVTDGVHEEIGGEEATNNKRPSMGENLQAMKKQCGVGSSSGSKKPKPKSVAQSKDPQSVAAKNRRERISERLKTLQELVPNGSKVDLVTMLEKAIGYVKFLQLQVKVLATDEFWPAQGGKAPDLSQVREAIDAILASQRDRSSTTSK